MAIQAPDSLGSAYVLPVKAGTPWYKHDDLTGKLGEFSSARDLKYVGLPIGKDSRAVIVVTSKPYGDGNGEDKPTVVYVKKSAGEPKKVSTPPPDTAARDQQWRDWLNKDASAPDKTTGATAGVEDDDGDPDGE